MKNELFSLDNSELKSPKDESLYKIQHNIQKLVNKQKISKPYPINQIYKNK